MHRLGRTNPGGQGSSLSMINSCGSSRLPPTVLPDLGWKKDFDETCSKGKLLGRGSSGIVHAGCDVISGEEVAIKIMPKLMGSAPKGCRVARICKEARHLDSLVACPSVAHLRDCFEGDSHAALVLELCTGGDLEAYVMDNGPVDEAGLALIAREVLRMLDACHELGICHGDVKPPNFCLKHAVNPLSQRNPALAELPWLKAIDFGSSCDLPAVNPLSQQDPALAELPWLTEIDFGSSCGLPVGSGERLSKWVGTPVFMAPEVYRKDYGLKADVWSAGVMLYWLFANRYPFFPGSETEVDDVAVAVCEAPVDYDYGMWTGMSEVGKDFIQRCLQRNEGERMSAREALDHPWLSSALAVDKQLTLETVLVHTQVP
eukprot:gene20791-27619_t